MAEFNLQALREGRDAAIAEWRCWDCSVEDFIEAYKQGERDFRRANLRRADLSDADLRRANLSDADLSDANLSAANLRRANLSDADLRRANLRRANLSDANLRRANLSDADLSDADLRRANLSDADLSDADLRRANLSDADLRRANLSAANLSAANGILSAIDYLAERFETTVDGYIAYKVFGASYSPNPAWKIEVGSVITETVNPDRGTSCGSGINVATPAWIKANTEYRKAWKVLIRWSWLPGVVVPFGTDGKIRCERVELIEEIKI
jgi:hypothetical protein